LDKYQSAVLKGIPENGKAEPTQEMKDTFRELCAAYLRLKDEPNPDIEFLGKFASIVCLCDKTSTKLSKIAIADFPQWEIEFLAKPVTYEDASEFKITNRMIKLSTQKNDNTGIMINLTSPVAPPTLLKEVKFDDVLYEERQKAKMEKLASRIDVKKIQTEMLDRITYKEQLKKCLFQDSRKSAIDPAHYINLTARPIGGKAKEPGNDNTGEILHTKEELLSLFSPYSAGEEKPYTVCDPFGERTLITPVTGDWGSIVLDIEARTRVRLKDGQNSLWFFRLHKHFQERSNPADGVSFAEYVMRRYPDSFDVIPAVNPSEPQSEKSEPLKQESATVSEPMKSEPAEINKKTAPGNARFLIISALEVWHGFQSGRGKPSVVRNEPVGVNQLAEKACVSAGAVSNFFKKEFKGHDKYAGLCNRNTQSLIAWFRKISLDDSLGSPLDFDPAEES
jgi:hypothetical protein